MKQNSYSIMVLLAMTLLGGIAIGSTPLVAQDTNRTKRVANSDPWQTYPRWTPPTYLNVYDGEGNLSMRAYDFDLRGNGEVHLIIEGNTGDSTFIAYANDRPETRSANGFSPPRIMRSASRAGERVEPGDIAVSEGGQIALAYTVEKPGDSTSPENGVRYSSIYLMRFLPDVGWGEEELVAEGDYGFSADLESKVDCTDPRLFYDQDDQLHISWFERFTQYDTEEGEFVEDERSVHYSYENGTDEVIATGDGPEVVDEESADYPEPPVVVEARVSERPHVVWPHRNRGNDVVGIGVRFAAGWNTSTATHFGTEPDFAINPTGATMPNGSEADRFHLVFVHDDTVRYEQMLSGNGFMIFDPGTASNLPKSPVTVRVGSPKVALAEGADPVVLFSYGDDRIGMASYRSGVSHDSSWSLQAPIAMPPWILDDQIAVTDAKMSPSTHNVHILGRLWWSEGGFLPPDRLREGGFYARTREFNVGDQDSLTNVEFGPGVRANVVTGNLDLRLPLFEATDGGPLEIDLELRYNSLDDRPSTIGRGWKLNYDMSLTDHGTSSGNVYDFISLRLADGRDVIFSYREFEGEETGYHVALDDFGYYSKIERDRPVPGAYTMTTKHGDRYLFDLRGRLTRIIAPTQDTIAITRGANPNAPLRLVPAGLEPSLILDVRDPFYPERPATAFRYDERNRLSGVTAPSGAVWTFSYRELKDPETGYIEELFLEEITFPDPGAGDAPVWTFENDPQVGNLIGGIGDPRGFYSYEYYVDRRVAWMSEAIALSVVDDLNPGALPELVSAERSIEYVDPLLPFDRSFLGREPGEEVNVPRAIVTDRRGNRTSIEYQYVRALADRITWPVVGFNPDQGVLQRRYAGYDPVNPAASFPTNRNLVMEIDEVGAVTGYAWHETATPPHVKDNIRAIYRPTGPAPTDIFGAGSFLRPVEHTWTDDGFNRIASVTDARANRTEYEYDATGNLVKVIYPLVTLPDGSKERSEERFDRDARGRITTHTDAEGGTTTMTYAGRSRNPVTIRRPGTTGADEYRRDVMGNLLERKISGGGVTEYGYDPLNRRVSERGPETQGGRGTTTWTWDAVGNRVSQIDPTGVTTSWYYDPLSRCTMITSGNGNTMELRYDREGNLRSIADFGTPINESVEQRIYDERNRQKTLYLRADRNWDELLPSWHSISREYDPAGNVITEWYGGLLRPGLTAYRYDARGNVVSILHPENIEERFTWDANDNMTTERRYEVNLFGGGTTWFYDERNRIVGTQPDAVEAGSPQHRTDYWYDGENRLRRQVDPLGNEVGAIYDLRGNLQSLFDHDGDLVEMRTRDDRDLLTRVERPDEMGNLLPLVEFEYDPAGNLVKETDDLKNVRTHNYDLAGRLVETTEPNGLRRSFEYDGVGNRTRETSHSETGDVVHRYKYDANGNLVAVIDPKGEEWRQELDVLGRKRALYYPRDSVNRYARKYDVVSGRIASRSDRNGNESTFRYDDLGRLVRATHSPDSLEQRVVAYGEYDLFGNPGLVSDEVSSVERTYDLLGRLTAQTTTVGDDFFSEVDWAWDDASNLKSILDPEGLLHTYSYDRNNRVTTISVDGEERLSYEYDPAGRLSSREHVPTGTEATQHYNARGDMVRIDLWQENTTLRGSVHYGYDAMGNRISTFSEHSGITQHLRYDDLSRLTGETWEGTEMSDTVVSYTYDMNGNRLSRSTATSEVHCRYDHLNRLLGYSLGEGGLVRLIPAEDASASSTSSGFDPVRLIDGITEGEPTPEGAWKGGNEGNEVSASIAFDRPVNVAAVKLYLPDRHAEVDAFRLQWHDGEKYLDLDVVQADGAEPSDLGDGTWRTNDREVTLYVRPQLTGEIRYVQSGRAMLNEIQAFTGTGLDFDVEYRYDRNGNVVQRESRRPEDEFIEDFRYDYADRKIGYVKRRNDDAILQNREGFLPTGERVRFEETIDEETITTWFVADGGNVLVDYLQVGGGDPFASAIWVGRREAGVRDLRIDPVTAQEHFLLQDPVGSLIGSVDRTGAIGPWNLLDVWGVSVDGEHSITRYGFAGRERDASGLLDFGGREYDPEIGRFLGVDTSWSERIRRPYLYADNSPLRSITEPTPLIRLEVPSCDRSMETTFEPLRSLTVEGRFGRLR